MAILCGVLLAMAAFYHDSTDISNADERKIVSYRLITNANYSCNYINFL